MSIFRMKSVLVVPLLLPLLLFSFVFSQPDFFHDSGLIVTVRDTLNRQPDGGHQSQAEVVRIFAHPNGPLHRAMNAQPELFAAILFTVFRAYFDEVVFAQPHLYGQRNPLLVMLKDHQMLPRRYDPEGRMVVLVHFEELQRAWTAHRGGRLVPADQAAAVHRQVGVLPPRNDPDPNQVLAVPELFQPLFVTERNMRNGVGRMQAEERYGHLEDRFLGNYVANYLAPPTRRACFLGYQNRPLTRLLMVKALYWMLVVRPFQAVIRNNPELFPNFNPDALTPGAPAPAPARARVRAPARAPAPAPAPVPAPARGRVHAFDRVIVPAPVPAPAPAPGTIYVLDPARAFALVPALPQPPLPQSKCLIRCRLSELLLTTLFPFFPLLIHHHHFHMLVFFFFFFFDHSPPLSTHRRNRFRRRPSHTGNF